VLERFGIEPRGRLYPSLLLGAVELTPIEVAQLYNTLANGGFRVPLRAVQSVVDGRGRILQRYSLAIEQVADPVSIYALNQALVQVMERGTGVRARRLLPADLRTAGKTGTSDDLRDSWFAGFADGHLVVTWVGNDGNAAVDLTGATGASRVWARVMRGVGTRSYAPPPPAEAQALWIDYHTGLATDGECPDAVYAAMTAPEVPPKAVACGSTTTRIGSRIRQWIRNRLR
jgi:penicillin-binding protein 1B